MNGSKWRQKLAVCGIVYPFYEDPYITQHFSSQREGAGDMPKIDRLLESASQKQSTGDLMGALADYDEILHVDSQNAEAYLRRGNIYAQMADYDLALDDFSQAIYLMIDDVTVYFNRGSVYAQQGEFAQAIDDFSEYLKMGGGKLHGTQEAVEEWIRDLEQKLHSR